MDLVIRPGVNAEVYWFQRREFLENAGYRLRPKFHPDFALKVKHLSEQAFHEYTATHLWHTIMDAQRISDGRLVMLKAISKQIHPYEAEMGKLLSSPPHAGNPRNHCIPIFDILQDPYDADKQIIVMPFLVRFSRPKFDTVGEVIECFRQIFEAIDLPPLGIEFMHENFIAHRDCGELNLLQDPTVYPAGFHPVSTWRDPSYQGFAYHITRTKCWPRYYIIDFGLSRQYDPANGPPLEDVILGGDKSPPEHKYDACNPFPTDIYFVGNLLKVKFLYAPYEYDSSRVSHRTHTETNLIRTLGQKPSLYPPFRFLKPLIVDMTLKNPAMRPTIGEVIVRFDALCSRLSEWHLRKPGERFYSTWGQRIRQLKRIMKRIPALPRYTPRPRPPLSDEMRMFFTQTPGNQFAPPVSPPDRIIGRHVTSSQLSHGDESGNEMSFNAKSHMVLIRVHL
ncbi:hypothetical protein B0H13DRAFT_1602192 [Mycena leptocephala]|nr:hypothetical protein B0H13DRAFT_1602192 [Mycena leptocephala]